MLLYANEIQRINEIWVNPKYLPQKTYQHKGKHSSFMVEKSADTSLSGQGKHHQQWDISASWSPSHDVLTRVTVSFLWYSCQNCIVLAQSWENTWQTYIKGHSTKLLIMTLQKVPKSWRQGKMNCHRLQVKSNAGYWKGSWNWKMIFAGKLVNFEWSL